MTQIGSISSSPLVYRNRLSYRNRMARVLWTIAWILLYRPSLTAFFGWRCFLLRSFGARIGAKAHPYPRCRIWAPWNLTMGAHSCLADDVDCYSVDVVVLGDFATVSQQAMLCTATHDYNDPDFRLITKPIVIGARAWVGARAFVGPGVVVGEGAVVGATATVFANVDAWTVVGGNPARQLKARVIGKQPESVNEFIPPTL
jgi:putative colanic acid biosynthesis acetyltransferase WcaF